MLYSGLYHHNDTDTHAASACMQPSFEQLVMFTLTSVSLRNLLL